MSLELVKVEGSSLPYKLRKSAISLGFHCAIMINRKYSLISLL